MGDGPNNARENNSGVLYAAESKHAIITESALCVDCCQRTLESDCYGSECNGDRFPPSRPIIAQLEIIRIMAKNIEKTKWSSPWMTFHPNSIKTESSSSTRVPSRMNESSVSDDNHGMEAINTTNEEGLVIVPITGWYALYFGVDQPLEGHRKRKEPSYSPDGVGESKIGFTLWMESPEQDSSGSLQTVSRKRSLPIRDGNVELASCRVGVLIFITEGVRMRIEEEHAKPTISSTDTDSATVNQPLWWRVAFHRYLERRSVSGTSADNASIQPDVGALAAHPLRRFCCSYCGQCFHNVNAVKQHMDVRHSPHVKKNEDAVDSATATDKTGDANSSIWTRPLKVLYQDDSLLVIDKPQGMPVMGSEHTLQRSPLLLPLKGTRVPDWPKAGSGSLSCDTTDTLHAPPADANDETTNIVPSCDSILGKPRPVHRLDAPTGGVLVVAKTRRAEAMLKKLFRERSCHKVYRALVYGKLQQRGDCNLPLSDKPAMTKYKPLRYSRSMKSHDEWLTVVELMPVTGRQHQLRKHLQLLRHPIVGDPRYGGGHKVFRATQCPPSTEENTKKPSDSSSMTPTPTPPHLQRLCLWALSIKFPHPLTGAETTVSLPVEPEWLNHVMEKEQLEWESAKNGQSTKEAVKESKEVAGEPES